MNSVPHVVRRRRGDLHLAYEVMELPADPGLGRHPWPGRRAGNTEPGGFVSEGAHKSTVLTSRGRNR